MIATNRRARRLAATMTLVLALAVFGGPIAGQAEAKYAVCKKAEKACYDVEPYVP